MPADIDAARHADMLANRVKKTHKKLAAKMERAQIGAYRLYDWDIPEVRAIVDWYEGHLVVAEYAREQTALIEDYVDVLGAASADALGVPRENVHTKARRTRPKTGDRYERLAKTGERIAVREGDLRFWCNLDDYLDTGLFPDHRRTRARVRSEAAKKRVLNLFSYTGSFSVYAARGGAARVTTVDASRTYLEWAEDNFALNELPTSRHVFVKDDVRDFLRFEAQRRHQYELIVCDPPSFSTGREKDSFDVQRDHPTLVAECVDLLAPGGALYFSTNHQRFEPQWESVEGAAIDEITSETVPEDYRNKRVHRCFRVVRAA
jgi:23S rRNA G2069 N7-methylase RlmK/C1962 C5-methylase RlmI